MRRMRWFARGKRRFRLSNRTSLERNAPESLTLALYAFVHGDIWPDSRCLPQHPVDQAGLAAQQRTGGEECKKAAAVPQVFEMRHDPASLLSVAVGGQEQRRNCQRKKREWRLRLDSYGFNRKQNYFNNSNAFTLLNRPDCGLSSTRKLGSYWRVVCFKEDHPRAK